MKNIKSILSITALISIIFMAVNCTRKFDGLELATYPATAEVFIDGFSSGLSYAAYGTSKVTAFSVDTEVKYKGTASMKFEVPDTGDPNGGYVGGVFQTAMGRDLIKNMDKVNQHYWKNLWHDDFELHNKLEYLQ